MLGVRRWRELVADRKKNGRTLFHRPKPAVGCSANGRRRKEEEVNTHKFWHWSAVGRESLQTRMPRANTPFQILTTLTVMIRILKFG